VLAAAAALMLTVSASYVAFTKLTRIKKGEHFEKGIIITTYYTR